jgi:hypothetical protein
MLDATVLDASAWRIIPEIAVPDGRVLKFGDARHAHALGKRNGNGLRVDTQASFFWSVLRKCRA